MSEEPPAGVPRCYECEAKQPELLDHLGEPYVCGLIEDLRQRITELEEKLAMLNTPDQADNIVTRNKALADLAVANQRIEELEKLLVHIVREAAPYPGRSRFVVLYADTIAALREALGEERDE